MIFIVTRRRIQFLVGSLVTFRCHMGNTMGAIACNNTWVTATETLEYDRTDVAVANSMSIVWALLSPLPTSTDNSAHDFAESFAKF